jgi:hypothetical protein
VVLLGFAALAGSGTLPGSAATAATPASAISYSWHSTRITAGGFVDGLVFSDAQRGLAYARTDIGGAYRWDAATRKWAPLLDFTGFTDWNELGVESIAADPHDAGKVWLASYLPIQLAANQDGRDMGERLAVDPEDDRILYLASPANGLWRSRDGGATWAQVASFPVTATPDDIGLSFDPSSGTLYASADGGASFTAATTGLPTGTGAEQAGSLPQLHTVPGRGGDLWLTAGDSLLYHSTDGGKAFAPAAGVGTVATLGFGKAAPGAGYPAIYLVGVVGGTQAIFRSTDGGTHWARINTSAQQWGWTGQAITGDQESFGRVYLATNGRGIQYGDPAASR